MTQVWVKRGTTQQAKREQVDSVASDTAKPAGEAAKERRGWTSDLRRGWLIRDHGCPPSGADVLVGRDLDATPANYLRAAQAYMLISMPTGTSTIFGAFQAIVLSFKTGRLSSSDLNYRATKSSQVEFSVLSLSGLFIAVRSRRCELQPFSPQRVVKTTDS